MNKIRFALSLIAAYLLLPSPALAQRVNLKQSDAQAEERVAGAVSSIQIATASVQSTSVGRNETPRKLSRITHFDLDGNRREDVYFDPDEAIYKTTKYRHDDRGQRLEEVEYQPDGSVRSRTVYEPYVLSNSRTALTYDAKGKLWPGRIIYIYRADGNLLKLVQVFGESQPKGPQLIWIVFGYNVRGQQVRAVYCSGGAESKDKGMGMPDENEPCGNGRHDGTNYFAYDARGNVVREDLNTINIYSRYEYKYDSRGNWVKKVVLNKESEDGKTYYKPSMAIYRKIEYSRFIRAGHRHITTR